jgi:hypothetical protein
MIWTVIGRKDTKTVVHSFHGTQSGKDAINDAYKLFPGIQVVAVIAGNHVTSTYIKE